MKLDMIQMLPQCGSRLPTSKKAHVDRRTALSDVHISLPSIREDVTFCGQRDFADVSKLRTRGGGTTMMIWAGPKCNPRCLVWEETGRRVWVGEGGSSGQRGRCCAAGLENGGRGREPRKASDPPAGTQPPVGTQPCPHLDWSPVRPAMVSALQNREVMCPRRRGPRACGHPSQQPRALLTC